MKIKKVSRLDLEPYVSIRFDGADYILVDLLLGISSIRLYL